MPSKGVVSYVWEYYGLQTSDMNQKWLILKYAQRSASWSNWKPSLSTGETGWKGQKAMEGALS